ncbi:hypothetical protein BT96DRAFT_1011919 [Gymnopus androsaceus JB14]|uniref:Protein kinase domain-containing protein n=1 Tax=Gymnopus androsaceus JB14 TaxID=1447944 RepID=A0A6A4IQ17_9AGAR|nr:hypothetical protein BT96DRAFT_1011919 [Gymnopus androsaceus JB14]
MFPATVGTSIGDMDVDCTKVEVFYSSIDVHRNRPAQSVFGPPTTNLGLFPLSIRTSSLFTLINQRIRDYQEPGANLQGHWYMATTKFIPRYEAPVRAPAHEFFEALFRECIIVGDFEVLSVSAQRAPGQNYLLFFRISYSESGHAGLNVPPKEICLTLGSSKTLTREDLTNNLIKKSGKGPLWVSSFISKAQQPRSIARCHFDKITQNEERPPNVSSVLQPLDDSNVSESMMREGEHYVDVLDSLTERIEGWEVFREYGAMKSFFVDVYHTLKKRPWSKSYTLQRPSQAWPFDFFVPCVVDSRSTKYSPKSDFSCWQGYQVLVLIEIFSSGGQDKYRILLEAASLVRQFNLAALKRGSDLAGKFILPVVYIDEEFVGSITCAYQDDETATKHLYTVPPIKHTINASHSEEWSEIGNDVRETLLDSNFTQTLNPARASEGKQSAGRTLQNDPPGPPGPGGGFHGGGNGGGYGGGFYGGGGDNGGYGGGFYGGGLGGTHGGGGWATGGGAVSYGPGYPGSGQNYGIFKLEGWMTPNDGLAARGYIVSSDQGLNSSENPIGGNPVFLKKIWDDSKEEHFLKMCKHQNVIDLIESFRMDGATWLVFPFHIALSVGLVHDRHTIRDHAMKITYGIAQGLSFLHSINVAHPRLSNEVQRKGLVCCDRASHSRKGRI